MNILIVFSRKIKSKIPRAHARGILKKILTDFWAALSLLCAYTGYSKNFFLNSGDIIVLLLFIVWWSYGESNPDFCIASAA